jgi:hypothetical protein
MDVLIMNFKKIFAIIFISLFVIAGIGCVGTPLGADVVYGIVSNNADNLNTLILHKHPSYGNDSIKTLGDEWKLQNTNPVYAAKYNKYISLYNEYKNVLKSYNNNKYVYFVNDVINKIHNDTTLSNTDKIAAYMKINDVINTFNDKFNNL